MWMSQAAEGESTGSPVIGVFHTLSAGNAGHGVRGNTGPVGSLASRAPEPVLAAAGRPVPAACTSTAARPRVRTARTRTTRLGKRIAPPTSEVEGQL